ncbi:MAG TPA: ABC transporter permease [Blastocatellia bacterium]|nr:ABC transporter permease [Blastocatellia bacterium]
MRFPSRRREEELDEEIQAHLRMAIEDRMGRGETAEQARDSALREFGNVGLVKEVTRDVWGWRPAGELAQDLRYGARMLVKSRGFTFIAVITLALGIGATTAIFSVVNAVLLRPLPYPDADRLLYVGQQFRGGLAAAGEPKFLFWREQCQSFEALAAYSGFGGADGNLAGGNEAEFVRGLRVSEDFFRVLGVYPALGRTFTKEEDSPGGARVAIISDELWRRRFGSDPTMLDGTVLLNDRAVTVIGIMPPQFRLGFGADLFLPMRARPDANYDPNATVVGRLKPGVTAAQAEAELKVVAEKYRAAFPRHMQEGEGIGVQPYQEVFTGSVAQWLWLLLGAVIFLLLIACANVANLQLTRAAARQREIAVRKALGASGGRIVRQLLTEGIFLALVGGGAGLLLAVWGTDLLIALTPRGLLPNMAVVNVDWYVLAFNFAVAVVMGLIFGLAPAWQARKVEVNAALKEGAGRGSSARGRLRGALVVAEVALSLILLVGAGLLTRTFANLLGVTPGFDPHNVLTCQIALNGERYDTTNEAAAFYRDALERISSLPGVEAAAVTNKLPLDWQFNMPVVFPGKPDRLESVQFRMISPDYFRVMRIDVKQGRAFSDADSASAPPAIIVNEAFAERFFDGQDPFAQQLSVGRGLGDPVRQVVGVVGDVKQSGLDRPAPPMVYVPNSQVSDKLLASVRAFTPSYFTVRTTVEPLSLSAAIKGEVAALDSTLALSQFYSMEEMASRSIASQRFYMLLLGLFAVSGLVLAAVGIYGVMNYSVTLRTREIGIRMALGAQPGRVLMMILKQGLLLTLIGIGAGLAGALALTRVMRGLLFGVDVTDPITYAAIMLLLAAVSLIACFIPARRATKVDPIRSLRYE